MTENFLGLVNVSYPWMGVQGLPVEVEESKRVWTEGGSYRTETAARSDYSRWRELTGRRRLCCSHRRMRPSSETWGPPGWVRTTVDHLHSHMVIELRLKIYTMHWKLQSEHPSIMLMSLSMRISLVWKDDTVIMETKDFIKNLLKSLSAASEMTD